jgi:hypothetical protein
MAGRGGRTVTDEPGGAGDLNGMRTLHHGSASGINGEAAAPAPVQVSPESGLSRPPHAAFGPWELSPDVESASGGAPGGIESRPIEGDSPEERPFPASCSAPSQQLGLLIPPHGRGEPLAVAGNDGTRWHWEGAGGNRRECPVDRPEGRGRRPWDGASRRPQRACPQRLLAMIGLVENCIWSPGPPAPRPTGGGPDGQRARGPRGQGDAAAKGHTPRRASSLHSDPASLLDLPLGQSANGTLASPRMLPPLRSANQFDLPQGQRAKGAHASLCRLPPPGSCPPAPSATWPEGHTPPHPRSLHPHPSGLRHLPLGKRAKRNTAPKGPAPPARAPAISIVPVYSICHKAKRPKCQNAKGTDGSSGRPLHSSPASLSHRPQGLRAKAPTRQSVSAPKGCMPPHPCSLQSDPASLLHLPLDQRDKPLPTHAPPL